MREKKEGRGSRLGDVIYLNDMWKRVGLRIPCVRTLGEMDGMMGGSQKNEKTASGRNPVHADGVACPWGGGGV